jgi:hypothetical protein
MDRTTRLMPLMVLLAGTSAGVCWAMLFRHSTNEPARVSLEDSRPPALIGLFAGAAVGGLLRAACSRWPRVAPGASVIASGLLGAALMAPLGWIVGDMRAGRFGEAGMFIGIMGGALTGLAVGAVQMVQDRRAKSADRERADYRESGIGSVPDEPD